MAEYTFKQFIRDQIDELADGNKSAFASLIGVSKSTVTRMLDEVNPRRPELDTLENISRATKTDLVSLIHLAYPEGVEHIPSPSAQVLANKFDKLPPEIQSAVLALMRGAVRK